MRSNSPARTLKTRFYAFGTNIYSWGEVHSGDHNEETRCGAITQHRPPLTMHDGEPVTCEHCLRLLGRAGEG